MESRAEGPADMRPESRVEKKERTRRAILDAALSLSEESSLAGISLRQVAKEVGIVPTAFYRHFSSLDELGLALVDESFESLRAMLRDVRRGDPKPAEVITNSVTTLGKHVHDHREHFAFIARERASGPRAVREAVRHELDLFDRELAADLGRLPTSTWSSEDLGILANLIVGSMVNIVDDLLECEGRPAAEQAALARAERQLRMVVVGAQQWRSDHQG